MQVTYGITLEDLVALSLYHFKTSRSGRRTVRMWQVLAPGLGVLFIVLPTCWRGSVAMVIGLVLWVIYSIAWVLLIPAFFRVFLKRNVTKAYKEGQNRSMIGRHTMTLGPDGVVDTTEFGEERHVWSVVEKIAEDENYVFIYLSATSAHVVPKRAFAQQADLGAFLNTARAYQAQHAA